MPAALDQLSALLDAKFPPRVPVFLPGSAFFSKSLPLPPEVTDSDLPGFAELALEEHSPFPLEQLRWGFLADRGLGRLFLHASIERRLRSLGHEDLAPSLYALPDFLASLAGPAPAKPEIRLLCSGADLSAVTLEAGATTPSLVRTTPVPQPDKDIPPSPEDIRTTATALLRRLPDSPHALPASVRVLLGASTDDKGLITLTVQDIPLAASGSPSTPASLPLSLSTETLWLADVRDRDFVRTEQGARRRSDVFWKAILLSLLVLGILIVSQIGVWTARHIVTLREAEIAEQDKHVAAVTAKDNLYSKLRKATQEELKVFAMLSSVIHERPSSVVFQKVSAESGSVQVKGSTRLVATFNRYIEHLRSLPGIREIKVPNLAVTDRDAPFDFTVFFQTGFPKEEKANAPTEDPGKAPKDPSVDPDAKDDNADDKKAPAEAPAPAAPVSVEPGQ